MQVSVLSEFIRTAPMQDDAPKPLPAPPVLSSYEEDMAAISEVHALKAQFASLEAGPEKPAVALVTGATGFLGAAVVHSLITKTDMRIVLLIRASSVELVRLLLIASSTIECEIFLYS